MITFKYNCFKIKYDRKRYFGKRNFKITYIFPFSTKKEYLDFVFEWKEAYWQLSNNIRLRKIQKKQFIHKNGKRQKNPIYSCMVDYEFYFLRKTANKMLEIRKLAKKEANLQYLKRKDIIK